MVQREKGERRKGIVTIILSFLVGLFIGIAVGIRLGGKEQIVIDAGGQLEEKVHEGNVSGVLPSERLPLTFYEKLEQEGPGPHVEDTQSVTVPQVSVEVKKGEPQVLTKRTVFLQVGAFKEQRNANSLVDKLRSRGYEVDLHAVKVKGETWYRVLVKFSSPKEAEEAIEKLKKEGVTQVRMFREE